VVVRVAHEHEVEPRGREVGIVRRREDRHDVPTPAARAAARSASSWPGSTSEASTNPSFATRAKGIANTPGPEPRSPTIASSAIASLATTSSTRSSDTRSGQARRAT
jgi:hypothetical protein